MTTTIIIPEIRHIQPRAHAREIATEPGQISALPIVLVVEDTKEENGGLEAQIKDVNYYYTLEALTPLADWLEESRWHYRVGVKRCQSLDEVVRELLEPEL